MHVHYVTSNLRKFQEASYILRDSKEWNLVHTPLEIEEIQGSLRDIVHHKAQLALMRLQAPFSMRHEALISLVERYRHVCT